MSSGFSDSAMDILKQRYLDEDERVEDRFRTIAEAVNLERSDEYYKMMISRDFLPNTPTIVNAGRRSGQLSACFVLPVDDSLDEILTAAYNIGMIQKTGGGTGFTLSRLRPKGAFVSGTRGTSSGPISFLHMYNAVTETIKQGGVRRGANMATMRVDHPDIIEFIECKSVEGQLSNFNISVMLTDFFMEAVKDGTELTLMHGGRFYNDIPARELFDKIAKQAWLNGEPGVIFIDTINNTYPDGLGIIDATNPCLVGETLIQTTEGEIPIEELVGKEVNVHCIDILRDKFKISRAHSIVKTKEVTKLIRVITTKGEIECTPEHLLFTKGNGWVEAQHLTKESKIISTNNSQVVQVKKIKLEEPVPVYDLTVDKYHNCIANGLLVHNCGEQPLQDYESCNLGSINLVNMLREGEIDFEKLSRTARLATAFLDDVISVNKFVLPEIKEATLWNRKIGLGVMGWGDALIKMGISYGSADSLELAERVMNAISRAANAESEKRALEFGPYPAWNSMHGPRMRNATRTTIAPTGSLAAIAGVSWGIEPLFGLTFTKAMIDKQFVYVNEDFAKAIMELDISHDEVERIFEQVKKTGSCQNVAGVPREIKEVFKTAQDLTYEEHILTQAAFQKYTDNAVSKTINLPNSATVEDIKKAIWLAYEANCKGLTMYRADTRKEEAVVVGDKSQKGVTPRPKRVYGFTEKQATGCGKLYVTVNSAEGKPIEVFIEPGSDGGCEAYGKALSRTISLGLRAGVPPEEYVKQLKKVSCKNFIRKAATGELVGKSCPDVVGRILQTTLATENTDVAISASAKCPNCGKQLVSAEGCWVCVECGFSECN